MSRWARCGAAGTMPRISETRLRTALTSARLCGLRSTKAEALDGPVSVSRKEDEFARHMPEPGSLPERTVTQRVRE